MSRLPRHLHFFFAVVLAILGAIIFFATPPDAVWAGAVAGLCWGLAWVSLTLGVVDRR